MEGQERRAVPQDSLRGSIAINPTTSQAPSVPVSVPSAAAGSGNPYNDHIAQQVSQFVGGRLKAIQEKRQERSFMDGQIASMQGQTLEDLQMEGDKWKVEGHRAMSAQSLGASLLRAQEQDIAQGAYEQDPDAYRQTLLDRIEGATSGVEDPRTRKMLQDSLMEQVPGLIDAHTKQHLSFQEQQSFDALANSVDIMSKNAAGAEALVGLANGTSEASQGLSVARRREAVTQGVINAFTNNNPAAYAHLEEAGLLNTHTLTATQVAKIEAAQKKFEGRLRSQFNGEFEASMQALDDQVVRGELSPIQAAEQTAILMAQHGMKMSATEGRQVYKRARTGVEIAEGTRGLNIAAAGARGNYNNQGALLQDSLKDNDSPAAEAIKAMDPEELADRLEEHGGNVEGMLNAMHGETAPRNDNIRPVPGAVALDVNDRQSWLRENQGGATRSMPLHPKLVNALAAVLPGMGLRFEVFSGGQPAKGSGKPRVGSTRHDGGMAADGKLYIGDQVLDHSNPEHQPIFKEVVRRLRAQGLTGFGAGLGDGGYMGNQSIHIGYGSDAIWSSTQSGQPVVGWLKEAWNEGPLGDQDRANYVSGATRSFSDDRPDPQAARVAAQNNLDLARKQAGLAALEAATPHLAEIDELFVQGELDQTSWRNARENIYQNWNLSMDNARINQESKMIRQTVADRVADMRLTADTQQAVELETSIAAAEAHRDAQIARLEAGELGIDLAGVHEEFMGSMIEAYESSGAKFEPARIAGQAADLVRTAQGTMAKALKAQEEQAIINKAREAETVGTLPADLQQRDMANYRKELSGQMQNYRAENPRATSAELGAMQRQAEVQYIAKNGIVDEALKQQINLAAADNWVGPDGSPRPSVVAGLQSFLSLYAEDKGLAFQYVPDKAAQGRMLAAATRVSQLFPDRELYTDVDLNNTSDPVTAAMYDAVHQIGLSQRTPPTPEQQAERVDSALRQLDRGNLRPAWEFFGGHDAATALVPNSRLHAALRGSKFTASDVAAGQILDDEVINQQVESHVRHHLEEIVPYMDGISQEDMAKGSVQYVTSRGAVMGNSFVMPPAGAASIYSQMFPGTQSENTAQVNTALYEFINDPAVRSAYPVLQDYEPDSRLVEEGATLGDVITNPGENLFQGPDSFSVMGRKDGSYVMTIEGRGSFVLPELSVIGEHYLNNR